MRAPLIRRPRFFPAAISRGTGERVAIVLCTVLAAAIIVGAAACPGHAHSYKLGDLAIGHVWSPPPEDGATGLPVYGPILNSGDSDAQLVGASSPIAGETRLRLLQDGKELWPDHIDLRPGKPFALAPWREHIWLSGLREAPRAGDSFELTLDFGQAGAVTVDVVVEQTAGH